MTAKSVVSISLLLFALAAPLAFAKVSEEEAARLGKDLTPLGAVVAGEGDVPAWTGGLTGVPEGIKFDPKKEHPPNPFPDDKIKYTITKANMGEYDALLTDGHKAMLKRVPGFKMNVYQSRRSCTVPKHVQEATKRNATTVELTADGEGVVGGSVGTPFPIPQSAKELMWNHRLRYVPPKVRSRLTSVVVRKDKPAEFIGYNEVLLNGWTDPYWKVPSLAGGHLASTGRSLMRRQSLIVSEHLAFKVFLKDEPIDGARDQFRAWIYSGETRRARRALEYRYEHPGITTAGMSTVDSTGGFDGALDRLDWSYAGGGIRIVPYSSYSLTGAKYAELIRPNHLNAALVRYEPHRVRAVAGVLREGQDHIYQRRVLHIDEDTKAVVAGELYDSRGKLWRVLEVHMINFYHVPSCLPVAEVVYDLQREGQYLATSLANGETPINADAHELQRSCFDPTVLFVGPPVGGPGRGSSVPKECHDY